MAKLSKLAPLVRPLPPRLTYGDDGQQTAREARDTLQPWRRWYKTTEWKRLRWSILVRDLFTCRMCGRIEADTSQLVADHIQPHRGDRVKFWDATNIQCICAPCHNSAKQAEEKGGFVYKPDWIQPPACPVTIVCGPPASGKSTYVDARRGAEDMVIDLDAIACSVAGHEFRHDWDRDAWLVPAMRARNAMLADLKRKSNGRAWFILAGSKREDRDWWAAKLSAEVVVLEVSVDECVARGTAQGRANASSIRQRAAEWWREYR